MPYKYVVSTRYTNICNNLHLLFLNDTFWWFYKTLYKVNADIVKMKTERNLWLDKLHAQGKGKDPMKPIFQTCHILHCYYLPICCHHIYNVIHNTVVFRLNILSIRSVISRKAKNSFLCIQNIWILTLKQILMDIVLFSSILASY